MSWASHRVGRRGAVTAPTETGQGPATQGSVTEGRPARHQVTLLSRPGCHLCDEARAVIVRVTADLEVPWEERDITSSPEDLAKYSEMIPVTFVDGVQHDFWRVSEDRLRSALLR